ncbi:MAG: hypothetical protein NTZ42_02580 [Candidatus Gribaldobacteria bacterium]|nr:hypothetical protein [Candidatus Gribaldobacteria bacterium]
MKFPFFGRKEKTIEQVEVNFDEIKAEDIVAPSLIEIKQNYIKLGERMAKSFFIFSYPRYLTTSWLSPLINLDSPLDVALFIHPADSGSVLKKLRKKLTEVQAEISELEEKGIIRDPSLDTAYQDIEQLRDELQTARERVFQLGVYITVYGDDEKQLKNTEVILRSLLESRMVYLKPALLKEKQGFISTCPYGLDQLMVHNPMNTAPLSSVFPFVSPDLSANEGILYGINQHNSSLVLFDRFSLENANMTLFAKSGSGKSLTGDTEVFHSIGGSIQLGKIGQLVENIIQEQGIDFNDEELEGKTFPGLKVWTFDENMKGKWGEVSIAARKDAPNIFYKFKTKSGREITTTGDHNLVALKNGRVQTMRGDEVKVGEYIPLPRKIDIKRERGERLVHNGFNISSAKFLKLAGLITAEGSLMGATLAISNTEPEVLSVIMDCLAGLNVPFKQDFRNGRVVAIRVIQKKLGISVAALGGGGTSGEKTVWPFIFNLSKEKIAHYLSAYFEGDGGIENSIEITATSKSEKLISDISYLLYSFGIIPRIHKTKKEAVGYNWPEKKIYWKLSISGQDNLRKFAENIGFISQRKRKALDGIIQKTGNTNVDFIPGVAPIFKEIYDLFSCGLHRIQDISNLKREHYNPSPEKVKEMISLVEERIQQFRDRASTYKILSEMPSLAEIIDLGENNKDFNRELWKALGHSWHVVKYRGVKPGFANASKMIQIVSDRQYELVGVKQAIYSGFQEMDLEVKHYCCPSIQGALVACPESNTRYDILQEAARYIWQNYQEILLNKIPKVEEKLEQLKILANSDLLWDPIVEIKKVINTKDKYVYDLTCENGVFLAGVGGMFVHNSYFTKVEILRYLMQGVDVIVLDPENEYQFLSEAVDGSFFKISLNSENHLNPFDLPMPREDEKPQDVLRSSVINLVGLLRLMLGGLTSQEDAIIDQALTETYASKDITPESDPATWLEKIPLMSDLENVLAGMEGATSLLERVRKFTKGSYANFFNTPSNINMDNNFVVFALRDMEDELRPMAMFVILRYIWNKVRSTLKKRILLIDEAWWIMQSEDGASFLFGICKRARKYWLGVTTITQDVSDFMRSDYGKPIISNSSLQFLMKQSTATIEVVQKTFNLTEGEKNMLLGCDVGEGVFIAGQKRVALKVVASYTEDQIITSAPDEVDEVAKIKEAKRQKQIQ